MQQLLVRAHVKSETESLDGLVDSALCRMQEHQPPALLAAQVLDTARGW